MEPHQGLNAKHVILIIIYLEELGVEGVTERAVVASVVARDRQKFRSDVELVNHREKAVGQVLALVSSLDFHKVQDDFSLVKLRGDPVADHAENCQLMLGGPNDERQCHGVTALR